MKRNIIIILAILVFIATGVLIYFLFFNNTNTQQKKPTFFNQPNSEQNNDVRFKKIYGKIVLGPSISTEDEKVRFFEKESGDLYETAFDGSDVQKISSGFSNSLLGRIFWSQKGLLFAALFKDGGQNFFYNTQTGRSFPINKDVISVGFSPNQSQIVYQQESEQNSKIITSRTDNSTQKTILTAALPRLNFQWLNNDTISAWPTPSGITPSFLITISQNGTLQRIFSDMYGFFARWSPDNKKIIFSHTDENGKNLVIEISNEKGENRKMLPIKTLADKCTWAKDNQTLYCMTLDVSDEATTPDDYYKGLMRQEKSSLVKIDTVTLLSNIILKDVPLDAEEIFLTPQENYIVFVNRNDGLLYSIQL